MQLVYNQDNTALISAAARFKCRNHVELPATFSAQGTGIRIYGAAFNCLRGEWHNAGMSVVGGAGLDMHIWNICCVYTVTFGASMSVLGGFRTCASVPKVSDDHMRSTTRTQYRTPMPAWAVVPVECFLPHTVSRSSRQWHGRRAQTI